MTIKIKKEIAARYVLRVLSSYAEIATDAAGYQQLWMANENMKFTSTTRYIRYF